MAGNQLSNDELVNGELLNDELLNDELSNDELEKIIDNSIVLDTESKDNAENKKKYLKNSMSEEYIIQYIKAEMPFSRAVRRGLEEHIEDLMTRLYHYENNEDSQSETLSDIDNKSVESDLSIHSLEISEL